MSERGSPRRRNLAQLTAALLRAWQGSVPQEEWRRLDVAALRAACAAQLEFGRRRRRNQTLRRAACPPELDSARRRRRTEAVLRVLCARDTPATPAPAARRRAGASARSVAA